MECEKCVKEKEIIFCSLECRNKHCLNNPGFPSYAYRCRGCIALITTPYGHCGKPECKEYVVRNRNPIKNEECLLL